VLCQENDDKEGQTGGSEEVTSSVQPNKTEHGKKNKKILFYFSIS